MSESLVDFMTWFSSCTWRVHGTGNVFCTQI